MWDISSGYGCILLQDSIQLIVCLYRKVIMLILKMDGIDCQDVLCRSGLKELRRFSFCLMNYLWLLLWGKVCINLSVGLASGFLVLLFWLLLNNFWNLNKLFCWNISKGKNKKVMTKLLPNVLRRFWYIWHKMVPIVMYCKDFKKD